MMQVWGDCLDGLRAGGAVTPIRRRKSGDQLTLFPISGRFATENLTCICRAPMTLQSLLAFGIAVLIGGCCPGGNCDDALRPNFEARHRVFVQGLNSWIGRPFNHTCLSEGICPPQTLESGLVRYTAVDWR
jgi:hypothetical protein